MNQHHDIVVVVRATQDVNRISSGQNGPQSGRRHVVSASYRPSKLQSGRGGNGQGNLVREVDALGGAMGRVADATCIQFRRALRKGLAVRSEVAPRWTFDQPPAAWRG